MRREPAVITESIRQEVFSQSIHWQVLTWRTVAEPTASVLSDSTRRPHAAASSRQERRAAR
ncbi:hypothetical protein D7Y27_30860 [Corallococcus sp. AB004]|nr:hypothetical protein D7Y27_30860 [Corallococcus sp. AB004]